VTLRQRRSALIGAGFLLGAFAVYVAVMAVIQGNAYASVAACHPAIASKCQQLLQLFTSPQGSNGGVKEHNSPNDFTDWLSAHGYTAKQTMQPDSRFWRFQLTEGGWLLAVSALLIGGAVGLIRRRGACGSSPRPATDSQCRTRRPSGSRGPPASRS
jgi:hypothetical protein